MVKDEEAQLLESPSRARGPKSWGYGSKDNNKESSENEDDRAPFLGRAARPSSSRPPDGPDEKPVPLPYPRGVAFIVTNEFCERFSYYGMRTVLALFLKQVLHYTEDTATVIYHGFIFLCYLSPIFGAMLADSSFGKFRTILYVSLVYALGQIILSVGAIGDKTEANDGIKGLPAWTLSFLGLVLIGVGTGGIKPCVSAFGAEQFKLPEQAKLLPGFFSLFYAAINAGSFLSTIVTPYIRQNVHCFGQDSCFPMAFAVPAALMIASICVFLAGYLCHFYVLKDPDENIVLKTFGCIFNAVRERLKKNQGLPDILDYSKARYGGNFVQDVKAFRNVCFLFLAFPVFWSLYEQQGSRWLFQAASMDGRVGATTILPDQMPAINPLLIIAMIPLFDYVIYPALGKIGLLKTPLQKLIGGGMVCTVAFIVSGCLEKSLEPTYSVLPPEGMAQFTFYNTIPGINGSRGFRCDSVDFVVTDNLPHHLQFDNSTNMQKILLQKNSNLTLSPLNFVCDDGTVLSSEEISLGWPKLEEDQIWNADDAVDVLIALDLAEKYASNNGANGSGISTTTPMKIQVHEAKNWSPLTKSDDSNPLVKAMWNIHSDQNLTLRFQRIDDTSKVLDVMLRTSRHADFGDSPAEKLPGPGDYMVSLLNQALAEMATLGSVQLHAGPGGIYTVIVEFYQGLPGLAGKQNRGAPQIRVFENVVPNSVHMLWQIPQIVIITAAEIMFSITGLQFAFTQAPNSMKTVVMAAYLLTTAFGNLLTLGLTAVLSGVFKSQGDQFFAFAAIMVLDMMFLAWMATRYTYYKPRETIGEEEHNMALKTPQE